MTEPLARLDFSHDGLALVCELHGEVDLSNVEEVRGRIVAALGPAATDVVLDLTDTSYLDSTGVRLLFDLAERLQARRRRLALVVADAAVVRRVLVLTQLDERVPIYESVGEALVAFDGGPTPGNG